MTNFKFPETDVIGCRFPTVAGCNSEVKIDPRSKEYYYKLLPGQPKPALGDFVVTFGGGHSVGCIVENYYGDYTGCRQSAENIHCYFSFVVRYLNGCHSVKKSL